MSAAKRSYALDPIDPARIDTFPYAASILDEYDDAAERIYPPIMAWMTARGLQPMADFCPLIQSGDEIIGLALSSDPRLRELWNLGAQLTKRDALALKGAFPDVFVTDITGPDWVQLTVVAEEANG